MKKLAAAVFIFILFAGAAPAAAATKILPVPFTTQAPQNQWRVQPFQDACEEASTIMVEAFYNGTKLTPANVQTKILDYVAYETKNFGFHKDTNASMTEKMINEKSGFWAHTVENATPEMIETQIDANHPVIFHAYTPALHNPHYKQPMNPYHVFVIIGYDTDRGDFITNDPGTNAGKSYRYKMTTLMDANHDWMQKNNGTGTHKVLFTEE